jgi:hypothetical protein
MVLRRSACRLHKRLGVLLNIIMFSIRVDGRPCYTSHQSSGDCRFQEHFAGDIAVGSVEALPESILG